MPCGAIQLLCGWPTFESQSSFLANGVLARILFGSSGMLKLIASMKLCTSLCHFCGSTPGSGSPLLAILHKCKLNANSGKSNAPVLSISDNVQISAKTMGVNPDLKSILLAVSPDIDCSPRGTADLNKCSNFF